eukprot:TRINITY_DN3988_c0_g1_i1.p1 TRINITY_DN3988_c0_g1~~TRINITY_DN3988_c0_g1_i1.p1  ORF type:complete len:108 (-),score=5.08 TRINITY_DN3988_c0_g1_i1:827-1150(-)
MHIKKLLSGDMSFENVEMGSCLVCDCTLFDSVDWYKRCPTFTSMSGAICCARYCWFCVIDTNGTFKCKKCNDESCFCPHISEVTRKRRCCDFCCWNLEDAADHEHTH